MTEERSDEGVGLTDLLAMRIKELVAEHDGLRAAAALIGGASLLTAVLAGCTAQERARDWGGTSTVELERGQKLVTATWKTRANLWFLTRPMRSDETQEQPGLWINSEGWKAS